jgi:hypothetical protein
MAATTKRLLISESRGEHRWGEAHPSGNNGGGGGSPMVRSKGIVAWQSVADGEGPAVAGDNPRLLL